MNAIAQGTLVPTLSLTSVIRPNAAFAAHDSNGEADCPSGFTLVDNLSGTELSGRDVGDELGDSNVFVTAITSSGNEVSSITLRNDNDEPIAIAVRGGSAQTGNSVIIAAGATETWPTSAS